MPLIPSCASRYWGNVGVEAKTGTSSDLELEIATATVQVSTSSVYSVLVPVNCESVLSEIKVSGSEF